MLSKKKKKKIVEELSSVFSNEKSVLFTGFDGLATKNIEGLKKSLRELDSKYLVVKKSLLPFAFKKAEVEVGDMLENHQGSIAIAYSEEEGVELAKSLKNFSKAHDAFKILGGLLDGVFTSKDGIERLALLPSKDILLGKFVGAVASPVSSFVGVLQANQRNLISVLSQINK